MLANRIIMNRDDQVTIVERRVERDDQVTIVRKEMFFKNVVFC